MLRLQDSSCYYKTNSVAVLNISNKDYKMNYVKVKNVESMEHLVDENYHSREIFKVKNESEKFCDLSQQMDEDEYDTESKECFEKHFVKRKQQIDKVLLKSFMKNLFDSNNIDSEEVHLVDEPVFVKEEMHMANAVQADNQVTSGNNEGKTEDIDISEQFIDGTSIHDRKEYGIKSEISISGPSKQLNEAEDPFEHNLSECAVNRESNLKGLNLKKHKCDLCYYATSKKVYLKHHIDSIHLNLKQYKCELCDYAASQKSNLKKHINSIHLNLKQHKCEFCDYSARQEVHLRQHINSIHLNLKQHKCELCDFAANQASNLKSHVNIVHLNLKQHICHLCEYTVDRKCDLQRHIESVHLKLKQHKCVFCDYATNEKNNLKKHIESVHWNLKLFKCELCDFAAHQRPGLKKHVESVHLKLKKYKCTLCDHAAYRRDNLEKHIIAIHS